MVSVVLVNWNGRRWLPGCLDSLSKQTISDFEIILVDNASEDDSVAYVEENYPTVKIIKNRENLGFAGGNNEGIRTALGAYILLLNTDTKFNEEMIGRLLESLQNSSLDVVSPISSNYDSGKLRQRRYISTMDPLGHPVVLWNESRANDNFFLPGVCLLFKKELYIQSSGLDANFFMYCEDLDWFWRLRLMGKHFDFVDDCFIQHYGGGSSKKGINYNVFLWRNQNTLQMLIKNYKAIPLAVILPLYFLQNLGEILFFILLGKPHIASCYLKGWSYNIKNLRSIAEKRRAIQSERKVGDWEVIKSMYLGLGKVRHLTAALKSSRRSKA